MRPTQTIYIKSGQKLTEVKVAQNLYLMRPSGVLYVNAKRAGELPSEIDHIRRTSPLVGRLD